MDEQLKQVFFDLVDEHFPKGKCKERGQAMVLVAQALMAVEARYNSAQVPHDDMRSDLMVLLTCDWMRLVPEGSNETDWFADCIMGIYTHYFLQELRDAQKV